MIPRPYDHVPSKQMIDRVKGMLKRAFGNDTFAKTLLQSGCSQEILAEFKRQDDQEHETQALLASIRGASLADRRFNLQTHVHRLTAEAKTARGSRWHEIQEDLQNCRYHLAEVSHQSGAEYVQQAIQGHFKKALPHAWSPHRRYH